MRFWTYYKVFFLYDKSILGLIAVTNVNPLQEYEYSCCIDEYDGNRVEMKVWFTRFVLVFPARQNLNSHYLNTADLLYART